MKFFKKLNRGAILSFFVLLALILYLVSVAIGNGLDTPKIKAQCEKYIQAEIGYKMLPKQFRTDKPTITKAELDAYIGNMEKDIKAFYPLQEGSTKFILDSLKTSLLAQAKGENVVYDFKKEIIKYNDFVFDNDTVNVTFRTNSVYEAQNSNNPLAKTTKISAETDDTLILQKINGEWKIVYSNLNIPIDQNNMGGNIPYEKYR